MSTGQAADLYAVLGLRPNEAQWKRGNELVSGMKTALTWFAGFEAVKGIGEAIKGTIDLGGHLDDLRQRTGLSAESLQAWGAVAKLGGSDMDSMAHGMGHLARTMKEAGDGSEEAGKAIRAIGLTGKDVTDALKGGAGLDAALLKIADKFNSMPDGPQKTALAMGVFGRSGAELIPTLNLGSEGLAKLKQEMIDLGIVMSEDAVTSADALGDNIDKLKMSITGLKNQAVSALLPTLKEMVDSTLAWIKANKTEVVSALTAGVNTLISAFKILGDAITVVVSVIGFFQEHSELLEAILGALGIVLITVAAEATAAWIAVQGPFVILFAAVVGLILLFKRLYEAITTGKGVLADFGRDVARTFHDVVDGVKNAFGAIKDFFVGIGSAIKSAFVKVFDWIAEKLAAAYNMIDKAIHYATHPWEIPNAVKDYYNSYTPGTGSIDKIVTSGPIVQRSQSNAPVVKVDAGDTTVTINANAANATEVGEIVDQKIKDHHDKVWRDTHVATGGADSDRD